MCFILLVHVCFTSFKVSIFVASAWVLEIHKIRYQNRILHCLKRMNTNFWFIWSSFKKIEFPLQNVIEKHNTRSHIKQQPSKTKQCTNCECIYKHCIKSILLPINSLFFKIFHIYLHSLNQNITIYTINNVIFPKQIEKYKLIHHLNTQ